MPKVYPLLFLALAVALSACSTGGDTRPAPPALSGLQGEWLWLAQLDDGTEYSGYLSVSENLADYEDVKDAQGGAWRWCDDIDNCPETDGVGLVSNIYAENAWRLTTSFVDGSQAVKLIAFDDNNTVGTEIEGNPTFLGAGIWYETSTNPEVAGFGMVKLSNTPSIASTTLPVTLHGAHLTLHATGVEEGAFGSRGAIKRALTNLVRNQ